MDMEQRDYDSRTALHVAAAEGENLRSNEFNQYVFLLVELMWGVCVCVSGHAEVVRFLLEACKVNPVPKDR